jgi:hypothetical protein
VLGFEIPSEEDPGYISVHDADQYVMAASPNLEMAYPPGQCARLAPAVPHLTPKYHLLHKILRNTIAIKQGDKGMVRGWLINTLFYLEKGKRLHIMHYIYEEMRLAVLEKKCCILAPYIQLLIERKAGVTFPMAYKRTEHKVLHLQGSAYAELTPKANPTPTPTAVPTRATRASSSRATDDHGWKTKLKKLFCLHLDTQK